MNNFLKKNLLLLTFAQPFSQLHAESDKLCSLTDNVIWEQAYYFLFESDRKLLDLNLSKEEAVRKFGLETSMEEEFNEHVQEMICYLADEGKKLERGIQIMNAFKGTLNLKILGLLKLESFAGVSSKEFSDFVKEFEEVLQNLEFQKGDQTSNMGGVISVDTRDLRFDENSLNFVLSHELGHAVDEMTMRRHVTVRRCLSQQKNPEMWADEFAAKLMLASGLSRSDVIRAVDEVVGSSMGDDLHPDGQERVRNLENL